MLPVPFLENLNGCLRCHKSLSPLKTRADTEQTSQGRQSVLPQVMLKNSEVPEVTVKLKQQGVILRQWAVRACSGTVSPSVKTRLPTPGVPYLASATGNLGPEREVHGKRSECWRLPVCSSYWKERRGRRKRRTILKKQCKVTEDKWLGLHSKEENTAHTVVVHYLSCNWIIDLSGTSWAKQLLPLLGSQFVL